MPLSQLANASSGIGRITAEQQHRAAWWTPSPGPSPSTTGSFIHVYADVAPSAWPDVHRLDHRVRAQVVAHLAPPPGLDMNGSSIAISPRAASSSTARAHVSSVATVPGSSRSMRHQLFPRSSSRRRWLATVAAGHPVVQLERRPARPPRFIEERTPPVLQRPQQQQVVEDVGGTRAHHPPRGRASAAPQPIQQVGSAVHRRRAGSRRPAHPAPGGRRRRSSAGRCRASWAGSLTRPPRTLDGPGIDRREVGDCRVSAQNGFRH